MGNNNQQNPTNPNQTQHDPNRKQAPGYDDRQSGGQQGQRSNTDVEQGTDQSRKTPKDNEQ